MQDERYMRLALEVATRAPAAGEIPIGAVITLRDQILASAHNNRESRQDPTAHAEIVAIRAAAARLGSWRLLDTTMYVTLEPCTMCIGAIILARIPRLVFGVRDPKAGACGSVFDVSADSRLNHRVEVTEGILAEESRILLQQFFSRRRAEGRSATLANEMICPSDENT
jgi:tRNA(adenine34) deaminase